MRHPLGVFASWNKRPIVRPRKVLCLLRQLVAHRRPKGSVFIQNIKKKNRFEFTTFQPYDQPWTSWSTWTEHSFEKFQNAIFLKIFEIPSMRVLKWVQNLTNFFLFEISQQMQSLETSKVSAEMGRGRQAVWVLAKIFSSNLQRLVMNKCWKFQEDILIFVWFIAK